MTVKCLRKRSYTRLIRIEDKTFTFPERLPTVQIVRLIQLSVSRWRRSLPHYRGDITEYSPVMRSKHRLRPPVDGGAAIYQ